MQRNWQLLNRFSLRQILAILTLTAGIAAVLRHIRLDNGLAYGFLLAPAILYATFRVTGIALRPARWLALRSGLVLGVLLLVFLAVCVAIEPMSLIAVLPVVSLWMPQLAIAEIVETNLTRNTPDVAFLSSNRAQLFLVCISAFLILITFSLCLYEFNHHIIGKGTAFGRYWILVGSGGTTEFQSQNGYSNIAWQWSNGAGRAIPAYKHRDWQFLGLARYRVGGKENLRVPHWITIGALSICPSLWFLRRRGDSANAGATPQPPGIEDNAPRWSTSLGSLQEWWRQWWR